MGLKQELMEYSIIQIKQILVVLNVDSKDLVASSTRILHLAKNFEQFFPELINLKKFNGFEMKQNDNFTNWQQLDRASKLSIFYSLRNN